MIGKSPMWKFVRKARWIATGLTGYVLALGGCVTDAQFRDFLTTEIARVPADVAGQLFLLFVQSISPFAGL